MKSLHERASLPTSFYKYEHIILNYKNIIDFIFLFEITQLVRLYINHESKELLMYQTLFDYSFKITTNLIGNYLYIGSKLIFLPAKFNNI